MSWVGFDASIQMRVSPLRIPSHFDLHGCYIPLQVTHIANSITGDACGYLVLYLASFTLAGKT